MYYYALAYTDINRKTGHVTEVAAAAAAAA